jgi:CPA1 family monovalent cation:H+ antiporter
VARKAAARAALDRIEALRGEQWTREDSLDRLRAMYEFRDRRPAQRAGVLDANENLDARSLAYQRTVRDLLDSQRRELGRLRDAGQISDEVVHAPTRDWTSRISGWRSERALATSDHRC